MNVHLEIDGDWIMLIHVADPDCQGSGQRARCGIWLGRRLPFGSLATIGKRGHDVAPRSA